MEYDLESKDPEGIYEYGNEHLNYEGGEEESYSYLYNGRGNVIRLAGEKGTDMVSYYSTTKHRKEGGKESGKVH